MLTRALIVLLLVLNVGVASWWLTRTPLPPRLHAQPQGIARLQLLSEVSGRTSAKLPPAPAVPAPSATDSNPVDAGILHCVSFGPFATADAVANARAQLQPLVRRVTAREQFATPSRGWRVFLPALPTPQAAQAEADRMKAAGFSDLLVMHEGADANAIALGRYGSESTARRRADALVAAGFAARAEPLGAGPASTWLDVAADPGFDPAKAQAAIAAPQQRALDCARLQ